MQIRADGKPTVKGRVVGVGMGKYRFAGGGVALMLGAVCFGTPVDPHVSAGHATFRQRGNTTIIRASNRSIIDYKGFDIGRGQTVRFIQPGAASTVLNRINGSQPTLIEGTLKSNGRVFLMNPGGILFSGTSLVQTSGLLAGAGNMSNADFLAGRERVTGVRGEVVNQGRIEAGSAALIGRHVENSGSITVGAEDGVVALISGSDVTLTPRNGNISIKVATDAASPAPDAGRPGVDNSGRVSAPKGRAVIAAGDIYSLAVRSTGTVRARNISVEGVGGQVQVSGTLDASDRGVGGRGGTIDVAGRQIDVQNARIDAGGAVGGGQIRVGGDGQSRGSLAASDRTTVDSSSVLTADAVRRGDGGSVSVNSAGETVFHGEATARGGASGGDGGRVETSGHGALDIDGSTIRANAKAASGKPGTWLIDPTDFTVNAGNVGAIQSAINAGTSTTIETTAGGLQQGNVTIDAPLTVSPPTGVVLSIVAENDVVVNQPVTTNGADLNILANFDGVSDSGVTHTDSNRGAGVLAVNNDGAATFGSIDVGAGALTVSAVDVNLNGAGATLTANSGVMLIANSGAPNAQSIGLGGGGGVFTLTDAEMQQIASTGIVSVQEAGNTDAVDINTLSLGATGYSLSVAGGPMTVDNIAMGAGRDLALSVTGGTMTVNGTLGADGGTISLTADDLAVAGATAIDAGVTGAVQVRSNAGDDIGIGTLSGGDLNLTAPELGKFRARTLDIGALGAGDSVFVGTGVSFTGGALSVTNLALRAGAQVREPGVGTTGTKITLSAPGARLTLAAGTGIGGAGAADGTGAGPLDTSVPVLDASVSGNGGVFVIDAGADLTVANAATSNGKVSVRGAGAMTIQNVLASETTPSGRTLNLVSVNDMLGTGPVRANGSAHFETTGAGRNITLSNADVATAANATVTLLTVASGGGGDATIVNGHGVALSGTSVGRNLAVTAATGDITDADTVAVGGNASFTTQATNADINLGTLAVTGAVSANTTGPNGDATLVNATDLNLAASTVTGFFSATATTGNITDSGDVTVGRDAFFRAAAVNGDIDLGSTSVGGAITAQTSGMTGDVTIDSPAPVTLAASTIGGALSVTAAGTIAQTGAVTTGGTAAFKTRLDGGGDITLTDSGNNFGTAGAGITAVSRNTADTALESGSIAITETSAGGNVMNVDSIATNGSVRLRAADIAIATVTPGATITAGMGGITLRPFDVGGTVGVGGGAGTLQLTTAELLKLSTSGTVTVGRPDGTGAINVGNAAPVDLTAAGYDLALTGGAIAFNQLLTLANDRQLTLTGTTVSQTLATSTPAVRVGGTNGRLAIDASGNVTLNGAVSKLAARERGTGGDIAYTNFGSGLEITTLGPIAGVSTTADHGIAINAGQTITVSSGVVTSGTGAVALRTTVGGDIKDNIAPGGSAITVGPAGLITLDATGGYVGGATVADAFKIDTGAGPGGGAFATTFANITGMGLSGVRLANSGTGRVRAQLTTDTGAASLTSAGPVSTLGAWSGDTITITSTGTGTDGQPTPTFRGLVSVDHALVADGGGTPAAAAITIAADDVAIATGMGFLIDTGAGAGNVTITRSSEGGINLGGGSFSAANGISSYLAVNNEELNEVRTGTLTIGGTSLVQLIRVQNVRDVDAPALPVPPMPAPTNAQRREQAPQDIGSFVLVAGGNGGAIRFAGDQASYFQSLTAYANAGIEVVRDIYSASGRILLDADADHIDEALATPFFTPEHDVLTFTGDVTLATLGTPSMTNAPDVSLSGRRSTGATAIKADSNLTINSAHDVFINQSIDVTQSLFLNAGNQVQLAGGGNGHALDIKAQNGIQFVGDIHIRGGGLSVNADYDPATMDHHGDDHGTFALLSGTLTVDNPGALSITAAEVRLDGSIAAGTGPVRISRSSDGDVHVGSFVDGGDSDHILTLDNGELSRIRAGTLTIGNSGVTTADPVANTHTNAIVVDGVGAADSDAIRTTILDAGTTLTFSGGASTFKGLDGRAKGDILVATDLTTATGFDDPASTDPNNLSLSADNDHDGAGRLTINAAARTLGGAFAGRGADLTIGAGGRINTASDGAASTTRGAATISRIDGNMVLENTADIEARMTIDDAELGRLTVGNITFGDDRDATMTDPAMHTNNITVRGFTAADGMGISGSTTFLANQQISFSNAASTFKTLTATAGGRVSVSADLSTTGVGASEGDLTLTGRSTNTADPDANGVVFSGGRALNATGSIAVNSATGTITTRGDLTLTARSDVDINGAFVGEALDVGVTAAPTVTVRADSDASGAGIFFLHDGRSFTNRGGKLLVTAAGVNLGSGAGASAGIQLQDGEVSFERSTTGRIALGNAAENGDLSINRVELARIRAQTLTIGGANTSRIDARTGGSLANGIDSPTTVSLRAQAAGGVVEFLQGDNLFESVNAVAADRITIDRGGSVTTNVGDLTLTADTIQVGTSTAGRAAVNSARDATLDGRVVVTGNTTVHAGNDFTFTSAVNNDAGAVRHNLTVNSPGVTSILGNVGAVHALGSFWTDTAGAVTGDDPGNRTLLSGNISTAGGRGIRFRDLVVVDGDVTVKDTGSRGVFFQKNIRGKAAGADDLTVLASRGTINAPIRANTPVPVIAFGGNIGVNNKPLRSLTLNQETGAGGAVVNERSTVPLVATVVFRTLNNTSGNASFDQFTPGSTSAGSLGDLRTVFNVDLTDSFTTGRREKIAVAGSLNLTAPNVTVGDVLAIHNLTIEAANLNIRRREPAPVGQPRFNGTQGARLIASRNDSGVDIVANDSITLRNSSGGATVVRAIDPGTAPVFASGGTRPNGLPSTFLYRTLNPDSAAVATGFTFGARGGIINLDLTSSGPSDTNPNESIAGFIPRESRVNDVSRATTISLARAEELKFLGIEPRALSNTEMVANLARLSTYDDFSPVLSASDAFADESGAGKFKTAVNRLPDSQTSDVLVMARALILGKQVDPETGKEVTKQSLINKEFKGAADRYRDARGIDPDTDLDPAGFRDYVDSTPSESRAKSYADDIDDLLTRVRLLGLVGKELAQARNFILLGVKPPGLQRDQFEEFLHHGRRGGAPAPSTPVQPVDDPAPES